MAGHLFVLTMLGVMVYICWKWWVEIGRDHIKALFQ